jgi:ADP-ribose pyrophosphatase YjhB (NUDIX family)
LIKTFASKHKKTIYKFPKGHLKDNEVLKQAAQREVEEEGQVKTRIVTKIGSNDYNIWDKLNRKKIIKKVTFFLMEYVEQSNLKYYDSEVVLGREWMSFEEAAHRLAFDSEKVLLQKAKWKLDQMIKK